VREPVGLNIRAGQSYGQRRLFENNPLAVVGERQLLRDVALLTPSKTRVELRWRLLYP
jgi:hypothetical protein